MAIAFCLTINFIQPGLAPGRGDKPKISETSKAPKLRLKLDGNQSLTFFIQVKTLSALTFSIILHIEYFSLSFVLENSSQKSGFHLCLSVLARQAQL
jgi:hypothetical protein